MQKGTKLLFHNSFAGPCCNLIGKKNILNQSGMIQDFKKSGITINDNAK